MAFKKKTTAKTKDEPAEDSPQVAERIIEARDMALERVSELDAEVKSLTTRLDKQSARAPIMSANWVKLIGLLEQHKTVTNELTAHVNKMRGDYRAFGAFE